MYRNEICIIRISKLTTAGPPLASPTPPPPPVAMVTAAMGRDRRMGEGWGAAAALVR